MRIIYMVNYKTIKKKLSALLFAGWYYFIPSIVLGYSSKEAEKNLDKAASRASLLKGTIGGTVGNVINSILVYVGIILMILIAYAGVLWMTAGGNEEQINKAKKIIKGSVIGFLVVILSYTIVFGIASFANNILK